MRTKFLIVLLVLVIGKSMAQSSDGYVSYRYISYDSEGKEKFFPLQGQQVFVSSDKILFVPESNVGSLGSLLMDASLNKRYEINHEQKTIYIIKNTKISPNAIRYSSIQNKDTVISTVLGLKCLVKEFKSYNEYVQDTTTYRYWLALSIPISNIHKYAEMQGHQNTLLLDGSLGYLPLRVETISKNGEKLITEAQEVRTEKIRPDIFSLPNYTIAYKGF